MLQRLKKYLSADTDRKELFKGSSSALLMRVVGLGAGYLFTLLITRGLGAEAMGIFALCLMVIQVAVLISRFGMDTVLLRFTAAYAGKGQWRNVRHTYRQVLCFILPVGGAMTAILFWGSPYLAGTVFAKPHLTPYFQVTAAIVLPRALTVLHAEALRGLKKSGLSVFVSRTGVMLVAFLLLPLWLWWQPSDFAPLYAYALAVGVILLISFGAWRRYSRSPDRPTPADDAPSLTMGRIWKIGMPLMLSGSLMLVMQWTDTFMLGMLSTEAQVGIYNVALRVAMLCTLTLFAINTIAAPKFSVYYSDKDMAGLRRFVKRTTRLIFWSSMPVALAIMAGSYWIMMFFGAEFAVGSLALIIVTAGYLVNSLCGSVGYLMVMTGRQLAYQNIILTAAAANVLMNYFFIPLWGIEGAAVASLISMSGWNIACVIYLKRTLNVWTVYNPFVRR